MASGNPDPPGLPVLLFPLSQDSAEDVIHCRSQTQGHCGDLWAAYEQEMGIHRSPGAGSAGWCPQSYGVEGDNQSANTTELLSR